MMVLLFFEQKVYLSPLDDIHYVIKWQDGSVAFCLPSEWSRDLDSLINSHSTDSTSGHSIRDPCSCHLCDKPNLSKQKQNPVRSGSLKNSEIRVPSGARAVSLNRAMSDPLPANGSDLRNIVQVRGAVHHGSKGNSSQLQ
jgi:hypothetical protein